MTLSNGGENVERLDACASDDDACRRILLEHEREREGKLRDIAASLTQPRVRRIKPRTSEPTRDVVDAANAAYQDKFVSIQFTSVIVREFPRVPSPRSVSRFDQTKPRPPELAVQSTIKPP